MVWGVVIVYARGLESNALVEYAARRGWEDIHVASDLAMVMRAVRAGKVEVLLASGLRGLGRSLSQLAATVRELADRGVGLCIPSLGILDAASRRTLLNTMGCVLESRAAIATERTTHGMVDVHRGEVAELRAAGMSGRQIATELGFSPRSVFNVLRVKCSRVK